MNTARLLISSPLGFLIGLSLGTLGGGGSILAVPALVYGAGEAAHAATTTSLLVVGATALVGMFGHLRAGRVWVVSGLVFGLVGLGGSFLGSELNRAIPGPVLLLAFAGLILIAAWRMAGRHSETVVHAKQSAGPPDKDGPPSTAPRPVSDAGPGAARARTTGRVVLKVVVAGTVVGFLTGFFGVGGGFVIVPALVLALGYEMPVAIGTSLLVIAVSSGEGLFFRLATSGVDWPVALPFTVAGIVGVLVGDSIAGRVPAAKLTKWFVWLLVGVAVYTGIQSLATL